MPLHVKLSERKTRNILYKKDTQTILQQPLLHVFVFPRTHLTCVFDAIPVKLAVKNGKGVVEQVEQTRQKCQTLLASLNLLFSWCP